MVNYSYIKGLDSFLDIFKHIKGLRNTSLVIFNYKLIIIYKIEFKIYSAFSILVTLKKFKNISQLTFLNINFLLYLLKPFNNSRFL
jgi:hypothetical protein